MNKNQYHWFIDQRYPDQLISEDQIKQEYGKQVADGSIDPAEKIFISTCLTAWNNMAELLPRYSPKIYFPQWTFLHRERH